MRSSAIIFAGIIAACLAAAEPLNGAWLVEQATLIDQRVVSNAHRKAILLEEKSATESDHYLLWLISDRYERVTLGHSDGALAIAAARAPKSWRCPTTPTDKSELWSSVGLLSPDHWTITSADTLLAVAMIRSLAASSKSEQAVCILDALRPLVRPLVETEARTKAWAAVAVGEVMLASRYYQRAIEALDAGQSALRGEGTGAATSAASAPPVLIDLAERALLEYELSSLRHRAQYLWDLEQFGPAWVAYRDAEYQRRTMRNYADAWQRYEDIRTRYAGTVYADAAEAYGISCLVVFSGDEYQSKLQTRISAASTHVKALIRSFGDGRDAGAVAEVLAAQKELLIEQQAIETTLKALPGTAQQAAALALERAKGFIARDPNGLYRGEAMLAIGDWYWEVNCQPRPASEWYKQARLWFSGIEEVEHKIAEISLDERVRTVSAPPQSMRTTDAWGNSPWSSIQPGMIVNQRTCTWYVQYQQMISALRELSCGIAMNDTTNASELLTIVDQCDPHQKQLTEQGLPSIRRRLHDDIKEGRLFANKSELDAFPMRFKPRLLTAELAYETERYADAAYIYQRLLNESRDSLPSGAVAYLLFQQANGLMATNRSQALKIFSEIDTDYPDAPSWCRVKMCLFVYTQTLDADGGGALKHLDDIMAKKSGTFEYRQAKYTKAAFLRARGRDAEAKQLFLEVLRESPKNCYLAIGAKRNVQELSSTP